MDPSFGTSGLAFAFNCASGGNAIRALAATASGGFVAAGGACDSFALARFGANGALDSTFGVAGKVLLDGGGEEALTGLVLQPDGKIVAWASTNPIRFSSSGTLDPSYQPRAAIEDAGFGASNRRPVAVSDGRLLVSLGFAGREGFTRISTDGTVDLTFGDGGFALVPAAAISFPSSFESAAQRPDGRVVVLGTDLSSLDRHPFVTQLTTGGALDSAFGAAGVSRLVSDAGTVVVQKLVLQADGKILIAGDVGSSRVPVLWRLSEAGALDSSFGTSGEARPNLNVSGNAQFVDVVLLPSGKILAVGHASTGIGNRSLLLSRFDGAGVADPSFGTSGTSVLDVGARKPPYIAPWSQGHGAVVSSSRYVIAGEAASTIAGATDLVEGALIGIVP